MEIALRIVFCLVFLQFGILFRVLAYKATRDMWKAGYMVLSMYNIMIAAIITAMGVG